MNQYLPLFFSHAEREEEHSAVVRRVLTISGYLER
jgi:hypothetical protein